MLWNPRNEVWLGAGARALLSGARFDPAVLGRLLNEVMGTDRFEDRDEDNAELRRFQLDKRWPVQRLTPAVVASRWFTIGSHLLHGHIGTSLYLSLNPKTPLEVDLLGVGLRKMSLAKILAHAVANDAPLVVGHQDAAEVYDMTTLSRMLRARQWRLSLVVNNAEALYMAHRGSLSGDYASHVITTLQHASELPYPGARLSITLASDYARFTELLRGETSIRGFGLSGIRAYRLHAPEMTELA